MNSEKKQKISKGQMFISILKQIGILIAFLVVAILAFNLGAGNRGSDAKPSHAGSTVTESASESIWTCPMHPEIRMAEPGKCPKCGMDLVEQKIEVKPETSKAESKPKGYACAMNCVPPLPNPGKCPICGMEMQAVYDEGGWGDGGERRLSLSPEARALAGIQTSPVERRWVERIVSMVGNVDYDETRLAYITAFVGGRLDRLFVDYTGTQVRAGDHMAEIYSPELLSAQEELFQARESFDRLGDSNTDMLNRSVKQSLEAARERLRLWGVTQEQIDKIETSRQTQDHITLYAQTGGIVINKMVQEGDYVETGSRIYTISDLSHVWVKLMAYESDLPWLRYGQDVAFTTEALPGVEFHGRVSFISPVLNMSTRTVDVRVNVENKDGRLKPGMYVRAQAKSRLARGGKVIEPELAGKWISPMHPEIIKDGPGACDVCGMALVPVEELGFVAAVADEAPLVIPASAPLITGKRAVVYVEMGASDQPVFEGREVTLGPRAGDHYIVIAGLNEGDRVVKQGAFKIDSSLQIIAKPSMMNPQGGRAMTGHEGHGTGTTTNEKTVASNEKKEIEKFGVTDEFRMKLTPIYDNYLAVQKALAGDDWAKAKAAYAQLGETARNFKHDESDGRASAACAMQIKSIADASAVGGAAGSIVEGRKIFEPLSDAAILLVEQFGQATGKPIHLAYCPMAFNNKGANWLQTEEEISNPYFGDEMLTCGISTKTFEPAAAKSIDDHSSHQN